MGGILERVYSFVPPGVQNLGISAFGYYWYKRRFGGVFKDELEGFKDRESFTEQQWRDYQTQELRKLLLHSFDNVLYYHQVFRKAGLSRSKFENFEIEDIGKLPILEKETLRRVGTSDLVSVRRQ